MMSSEHDPQREPDQSGPAGMSDDPTPDVPADAAADAQADDASAPEPVEEPPIDWDRLPELVRGRLAELAAEAVGGIAAVDVPPQVRPVARFAVAKRARLGAGPLIAGLRGNAGFRAAVVKWAQEHRPTRLDVTAADPAAAAAAALVLGEDSAVHYVELVARRAGDAALRTERDTAVAKAERLQAELDRVRADLGRAGGDAARDAEEREAELEKLRKRLRDQGVKVRQAKDEMDAARAEVEHLHTKIELERKALIADRDRERERADAQRVRARRAEEDARLARHAAREARAADEVRLALLVDTLDGAVTGLRRELALGGTGPRPADMVRGASPAQGTVGRVDDPAALDRLLALPAVHLIVDGYNVTKTGYPELPLADQRDRLNYQLAALAARTGAEVTVVYDGAGVIAVPSASLRGVRVLFSDPGVLADDVIRALVTEEPEGRPVVVVTSDRAVVDSVRRRGAHPVPSAVLLARLGRV
ncbi:MAG TPA: NYN domain-containing protein [Pseudonocardiaceae bacterium]|nr:NYN domain-containing protein [Pseudonocardiaceae bacterium]